MSRVRRGRPARLGCEVANFMRKKLGIGGPEYVTEAKPRRHTHLPTRGPVSAHDPQGKVRIPNPRDPSGFDRLSGIHDQDSLRLRPMATEVYKVRRCSRRGVHGTNKE